MDITKNEKQLEIFSVSSQLPENPKISDEAEAAWWHIDKDMLRFKLHFFLFIGGLGTAIPYIPVFARDSIGLSASSVAYVLTVEQFLYIFSKPLLGFLTDYFKKLKATLTILTVVSAVLLFSLLTISKISNFEAEGRTPESEFVTLNATMSSGDEKCNLIKINKTLENEHHTNLLCSLESHKQKDIPEECYKVTVSNANRTVVDTRSSTYYGYNLTDFGNENDLDILCSLCCNGTEDCYFISCSKKLKYNEETKQEISQFKTYQFWWFGGTLTFAYALAGSLFTLSDTACCETVAKTRAKFGRQRLYGAVGWGAMAPIGGLLYDYTGDYLLSWIIMGLILALSLWNLWKMDLVQPQFSQNILKDVGKVLRNAEFLAFELGVLLNGMGCGIIWFYQVWFLTNLGASRLLCGLVHTVQCFLGEIPFMFYSDWFIKKIGHSNILSFSLATYCIRFLFYSYLQDPWLTLPMEVVHGITYGLLYATVASYAKLSAKPGTEATTQSILFSTHEGLGWKIEMSSNQETEKKCSSKEIVEKKKGSNFWHIDREMFRFKLHFFLMEGALGAAVPFVPVVAKDRIGFSATSMAAINVSQRFVYIFTKPLIGYLADYFHKLKEILCIIVFLQGLFFFLILTLPSLETVANPTLHTFDVQFLHGNVSISVSHEQCKYLTDFNAELLKFNTFKASIVCHYAQNATSGSPKEEVNYLQFESSILGSVENDTENNIFEKCNENYYFNNNSEDKHTLYYYESNSPETLNTSTMAFFCVFCNSSTSCCSLPCTKIPDANLYQKSKSDFLSYQYWLYVLFSVTAFACMNGMFTLSDTACFETIQKTGADFGKQRLWTGVGWGLLSPIGGLLVDFTNDYIASFALSSVLWLVALWNIIKMELIQPHFSKSIFKDVGSVFRSPELIAFQVLVLLHGISMGFVWFYLIWFLSDIGGSRFLCGFSQFMQSFLGDIPFMFFSTWVLNKIGYFNVISLSLMSFFVRFLSYSYLQNPWYIIPVECLHGLTYGIFNTAVASYAKMNAKPGTEATTQALLFATHEGLGSGIGNILAGLGFDYLGGHQTYFYACIFAGCSTVVSILLSLCFRLRKRNFKVSSSGDVKPHLENVTQIT